LMSGNGKIFETIVVPDIIERIFEGSRGFFGITRKRSNASPQTNYWKKRPKVVFVELSRVDQRKIGGFS